VAHADRVAIIPRRPSSSDALQGRLGARLVKTWDVGMPTRPRPLDTWLRANLWHEFLDGTDTTFAGLTGVNAITFAALLKGDLGRDRRWRDGRDRPRYHPVRDHRLPAQYRRQPSICLDWRTGVTMRW
jgi:hypothetical protein